MGMAPRQTVSFLSAARSNLLTAIASHSPLRSQATAYYVKKLVYGERASIDEPALISRLSSIFNLAFQIPWISSQEHGSSDG